MLLAGLRDLSHGLRLGTTTHISLQLVARTRGRAEVSKSGPRPRPGGHTDADTTPGSVPSVANLVGPRTPFLAGRWWSNPVTVALCGKSWLKSPGSDRPGQHSGWHRSTALDDSCRSKGPLRGGSLCAVGSLARVPRSPLPIGDRVSRFRASTGPSFYQSAIPSLTHSLCHSRH